MSKWMRPDWLTAAKMAQEQAQRAIPLDEQELERWARDAARYLTNDPLVQGGLAEVYERAYRQAMADRARSNR